MQKKKRTVAGGCLAAVLVCIVAVLLFAYSGGEEHNRENAADAQGAEAVSAVREAETDEADTAFGADGTDPAVEVEACAFVENGQLKVMLYNLSGWDHMYVNQDDVWIDGENITQTRLEYEERLKEAEEELTNVENYYQERKALQDNLLEEIGQANGDHAQELTDYYNQKQEFVQQLLELQIKLHEEIITLNQEAAKCRILEKMGYDLIEEQKQRLEKLPADLNAQTAGQYGIPVIGTESGSEEVRDLLYQFWLETKGDGSLSETLTAEKLESQRIVLEKENPEAGTVYRTIKSMTVTFGTENEGNGLILTSVTAWGNGYLILVDESREEQRADDTEPISVHCYDRLHWLSSEDGTFETVVGSDEAGLTYEQLMESMLSGTWDGRTYGLTVTMFSR